MSLKSLTPDTNVLVRVIVRDDPRQAREAERVLRDASIIAVTIPCLCEVVWVLRSGYRLTHEQVGQAVRTLLAASNVEVNRPAAEAGLAILESGGDFADGVIAYEGGWLGGKEFVSFDRKAIARLSAQGVPARLL